MHRTLLYALAATIALAACATPHPANSGGRPHSITIQVINNLPVPTGIDVFIVGPAGTQWRLGFVPGGDSGEFAYRPDSYGQRYRLIAKRQLQRPITSTPFTFSDSQTRYAVWSLIPGIVTLYNGVTTTDTVMVEDSTKKATP
jgi:hypothetical protein